MCWYSRTYIYNIYTSTYMLLRRGRYSRICIVADSGYPVMLCTANILAQYRGEERETIRMWMTLWGVPGKMSIETGVWWLLADHLSGDRPISRFQLLRKLQEQSESLTVTSGNYNRVKLIRSKCRYVHSPDYRAQVLSSSHHDDEEERDAISRHSLAVDANASCGNILTWFTYAVYS